MSTQPPIPPDQRTRGPQPDRRPEIREAGVGKPGRPQNTREQGQAGNIHQNTHHQGHQQDR